MQKVKVLNKIHLRLIEYYKRTSKFDYIKVIYTLEGYFFLSKGINQVI